MSVWGEVQEALYQRWADQWVVAPGGDPRTAFYFEGEDGNDLGEEWAKVEVQQRPSGQGTLGAPGNRKMDRAGVVYARLRVRPGTGVARLSDLAENARDVFEGCRVPVHGIRFGAVQIGDSAPVDEGRWNGVTVEARFDYEQIK
jgi:hypothetical protein